MLLNVTVLLLLFLINFYQKCDSAETTGLCHLIKGGKWAVECTLEDDEIEAYCIPISNCEYLRRTINETKLKNRYCGPSNENKDNPHVCCEKKFIRIDDTFTETVATCGWQSIILNSRIIGGDDAETGEFPWLARVLRRDNQGEINFGCTGTLISSRFVLTAAHCLVSPDLAALGSLYAVALGEQKRECNSPENDCFQNSKTVVISGFVAHRNYTSKNHDNDIGLVTLREKVEFTNYIFPICLLEQKINPSDYYVSGWGQTEFGTVSEIKKKTILRAYNWYQCAAKYHGIMVEITRRQICAGGVQGKDSCQGDSGGPLMVHINGTWFAAGVVSFGFKCGKEGWPGIYTNLPTHIDWIKQQLCT